MAEALAENNRLPVTNDMANQSCFITAIAFLKFEFWHLYSGLLGLRLLKLKLFRVESALQFVILQHCINATTLLLYLLLLTIVCGRFRRYSQAYRAGFYPSSAVY